MLIGDNVVPYTYTDAQIRASATIGPVRPPFPIDLRIAGTLGYIMFPFPEENSADSVATLTDAQLAELTDAQLATIVD